jgi:alpha-tubulin suppressor-like RCC1 family protein
MSFRYASGIKKPGFNPLAAQTTTITYFLNTWGNNSNGQLGLGNRTKYSSPKQVGSLTTWSDVGSGGNNSHAVKTDGTLWSWGLNDRGQLGFGNLTSYSSPKQVGALTNWLKVSASRYMSTYAITTDGRLYAWGNASNGHLGLGNSTSYSSPKQVGSLTTWASVSAAYGYAGGITTGGTLFMWGNNGNGQLGLGDTTNRNSPNQVGALTNWSKLSMHWESVVAVKTDGTMWSWGQNVSFGALGLGDRDNRSSPTQIGALTTWADAVSGMYYCLAVKTDGTLWAWGDNGDGKLGLGNRTYYSSPKQVGSLTNWSKLATGGSASYAITTAGALYAWGSNQNGKLGLGNETDYSSPKQVGSLTSWYIIEANLDTPVALII